MTRIKKLLLLFRWWLISLIIGDDPVIMNCSFNCEGLKDGWVLSDPNYPEKSLISSRNIKWSIYNE